MIFAESVVIADAVIFFDALNIAKMEIITDAVIIADASRGRWRGLLVTVRLQRSRQGCNAEIMQFTERLLVTRGHQADSLLSRLTWAYGVS
jgi:hypothetical protein